MMYLNGKFVDEADAKVSVFDRGFLFSDGVYEVIPICNKYFFLFKEHIERLKRSLREILIEFPEVNFEEIATTLKDNLNYDDGILYIQVTRGTDAVRSHIWEVNKLVPSVIMFCQPLKSRQPTDPVKGLRAVTLEDQRWKRCDIKSLSLLPNILARFFAEEEGCDEAIFFKNGIVTEGSSSNVFIVKGDLIASPKLESNILPGVTRKFCVDVLTNSGFNFENKDIKVEDLHGADEVWLTSSTKDVMPVTILDKKPISNGGPGPVWYKFSQIFAVEKAARLKLDSF